jgi:methyl-branched lipid omega-hydroxylase
MTLAEIDLSAPAFWRRPPRERADAFALLRAEDGPRFYAEPPPPFARRGKGYWALVTHTDVCEASRNQEIFSSERGATGIPDLPGFVSRYVGSLINMDDPRHDRIRRVVSRAFTPGMLARTEGDLARRAARIVDELIEGGPGDFVGRVAARLPVEVVCDMLGIPGRLHPKIVARADVILGHTDPESAFVGPGLGAAGTAKGIAQILWAARDLHRLAAGLGRERIKNPADDLTSALVHANVDGERLTAQELGSFFLLLVVAGNETTRTAIAHGLTLFSDHPGQRERLLADVDAGIGDAVEEIIRYSTPVIFMRRDLTRDHEMNGHTYRAGDKVLLFYNSANRDEAVFKDPDVFDITRRPNPHVAFGAPGPHFCLGANLARRQITVMLREVFTRLPDIRADGEPERLPSGFINGYARLPCAFTRP